MEQHNAIQMIVLQNLCKELDSSLQQERAQQVLMCIIVQPVKAKIPHFLYAVQLDIIWEEITQLLIHFIINKQTSKVV